MSSSELIHPNWHVILIHYPLGLLGVGIVIELLAFLWRRSTFRTAGRWMILIGALSCIPTATSGIYALRDAVAPHAEGEATWNEVKQESQWNQEQWHLMMDHWKLSLAGTLVMVVIVCTYLGASDRWRDKLYWPGLVGLLLGAGLLASAAWHSGEAVYAHGTAVERAVPSTQPISRKLKDYLPPLQLHVIGAGATIAFALGALALTFRRWNNVAASASPVIEQADRVILEAVRPSASSLANPDMTPTADEPFFPPVYPARFWLIAFLLAAMTALGGLWVSHDFDLAMIKELFADAEVRSSNVRLFMHVILGVSIVALTLLLTGMTKLTPRAGRITSIFLALLLLAAAGQIYIGTLMTFDSMQGPLLKFNAPATQPASS